MKKLFVCIAFIIATWSCKDKYLPLVSSPQTGYLVVEGFINSNGATSIILTRTIKLYDSVNVIYEQNAQVNIEGENQDTYPLFENANGGYTSSSLNLNNNGNYRLHIRTQDGKEYLSDFTKGRSTPAIDSISWLRENGGIKFYINTHDPQNNTKYYQWKYKEVWEIHSAYLTSIKYAGPTDKPYVTYRNQNMSPDFSLFTCWAADSSNKIFIGTSEKLTTDKIYFPLSFIEPGSERLSVLYSINVRQYALSHEAYLFLDKIKKNTEQLGSIFDPQPSELKGNIHCVTNPAEIVIGFVEVTEEQQLRLFLSKSQVPDWRYTPPCDVKVIDNDPDSIIKNGLGWSPTEPSKSMGATILQFGAASSLDCIDCTTKGTNIKPAFWP